MARYINAENLEYEILHTDFEILKHECKDYESYVNGANCFRAKAKNLISKAPNCAVVPRSEFEELEKKLNDYKKFVGEIRVTSENHAVIIDTEHTEYIDKRVAEGLKNMGVHKAKQEVAKEIFEEIVKLLIFNTYEIACISKTDLAELKKKYIGE